MIYPDIDFDAFVLMILTNIHTKKIQAERDRETERQRTNNAEYDRYGVGYPNTVKPAQNDQAKSQRKTAVRGRQPDKSDSDQQ